MANSITTQVLLDGPRNVVVKYEGVLDASDLSYVAFLDPATLSPMVGDTEATKLRLLEVEYSIEDALAVSLFWDATTPRRIFSLTGRGELCGKKFGGWTNNATGDAGYTGKVGASTQGYSSGTLSFALSLRFVKGQ